MRLDDAVPEPALYIYAAVVWLRFRVCDGLDREAGQETEVEAGEDEAEGEEHGERAVWRSLQGCREHAQRGGGHPEEHLHSAGVGLGAAHQPTGVYTHSWLTLCCRHRFWYVILCLCVTIHCDNSVLKGRTHGGILWKRLWRTWSWFWRTKTQSLRMKCAAVAWCRLSSLSSTMWVFVCKSWSNWVCRDSESHWAVSICAQSIDLDLKHDCKPLMERINVFKAAFSENEDDER